MYLPKVTETAPDLCRERAWVAGMQGGSRSASQVGIDVAWVEEAGGRGRDGEA